MDLIKIIIFILAMFFKACMEEPKEAAEDVIAEEETEAVSDSSFADSSEEAFVDPHSYIGKFTKAQLDSVVGKKKKLHYVSVNNGIENDSTGKPLYGWDGSVDITKRTDKGFYFVIDVWNVGLGSGNVEGRAKFINSNRAIVDSMENDDDVKERCKLNFIFYGDKLFVEELDCWYFHGARCGFGDEYVLERGK